ncbi:MAG: phenylalanine--tRNA ligase subunit beta [Bernardetiaceae bacterium]|jgi:phenylalanyl-tRNA synthetase beta chain|nr:phenylalanine--tRNA ligase subunit beta [Bernardetiaceae bacterium]
MNISYQWLQQLIHLPEVPEQVGAWLTSTGLEVEAIEPYERVRGGLAGVVLGRVLTCAKHPNADKLSLTTVDVGGPEPLAIVCGAPNVAAGQTVVVATVGSTIYPIEGEPITLKKTKIRGENSEGMICAEDELGLGRSHAGIMVLATDLPPGTPAAVYFGLATDQVFVIGLTPNRADAASHLGTARDLKAKLGRALQPPAVNFASLPADRSRPIGVTVRNPEACPRYTGVSIAGVQVGPSPAWLQNRLRAIGLTPINNVVDATNYVLHELGQPLHAFDADKIAGQQIIVTTLPAGTLFVTLDQVERKLAASDLMICDGQSNPMCIGGVFGGANSGITEATTAVFLESAYFAASSIRATSQYHGLKTDASFRFERGTDPNGTRRALERCAALIVELAGGRIASEVVDVGQTDFAPHHIEVKYAHIDRLIGKKLPRPEIKTILQNLDFEILREDETSLRLAVPSFRVEVRQSADVVEEILRIYGFDNVELAPQLRADYLAEFPEKDPWKLRMDVARLLAANGFNEISTNSLTRPDYAAALPSLGQATDVEILNKLSNELGVMRQSLIFSGLEVLAHNLNRRQKDLKLFEFGRTYHLQPPAEGQNGIELKPLARYREQDKLALFMVGNRQPESWQAPSQRAGYYDLLAPVQLVLQKLGLANLQPGPTTADSLAFGTDLLQGPRVVARVGQLKPSLAKLLDVKQPVLYAELDWAYLMDKFKAKGGFRELSRFPEVRRDLSLVLDQGITFAQVRQLALATEKQLLQDLNVFDVYQGDKLEPGKKAYALSFTLVDHGQTLTDEAIDRTMQRLMTAFEQKLGAVIRK